MILRFLPILLCLTLLNLPILAQNEPLSGNCTAEDYQEIADALEQVGSSLLESDDPDSLLQSIQTNIQTIRSFCKGYTFSSDEYGNSAVLDPFRLIDGTYRVTLESQDTSIVDITELAGDCGNTYISVIGNDASTQEVSTVENCEMLIQIEGRSGWILIFEPIQITGSLPMVQAAVSSTDSVEPADSTVLNYGIPLETFLLANQDNEHFFIGSSGDIVTIGAVRTSGSADLFVELYDPSGNLLLEDDDSHPEGSLNPYIANFPLPVSGEYKIVITRCSFCEVSDSGSYSILVEKQ